MYHTEIPDCFCPWMLLSSNMMKGWKKLGCVNESVWLKGTSQWPAKKQSRCNPKEDGLRKKAGQHWDSPQIWFRPWPSDQTELKNAKSNFAQHSFQEKIEEDTTKLLKYILSSCIGDSRRSFPACICRTQRMCTDLYEFNSTGGPHKTSFWPLMVSLPNILECFSIHQPRRR